VSRTNGSNPTRQRRRSDAPRKPYLKLVGQDGNAFNVLGLALRAARAAGWTKEQQELYADLAMSGDYDNLLAVTQEFFDVH
jgi:hypothetical protein